MKIRMTKTAGYDGGPIFKRGMTVELPPSQVNKLPVDSYKRIEARTGKIRITKTVTCNYGTFIKGREVKLPPNILARLPKDSYEPVEASKESEVKTKNDNDTIGRSGEENQRVRGLSPGSKRGKRDKRNSDRTAGEPSAS